MPPQFRLRQRPALATPARTPYSFALSSKNMTHVVTEACINCKYTDCVDVCPVDCFKEGPNFLTIDPDECIDCAVCIPECPANAIYAEDDLPEGMEIFLQFNKKLAHTLPTITKRKAALPDAEQWRVVSHKLSGLNIAL